MAKKQKVVRVSEEEFAALKLYRENVKAGPEESGIDAVVKAKEEAQLKADTSKSAQQELADAFVSAIERTKTPEKKTVANRKVNTPWSPKNGEPRLKLKRKFYQHGISVEDNVTNEDIALLNQIKPGRYCDGYVGVTLRKDRGLDIDYPVRTASQKLRLINNYGVRSFTELLQRIIDEKTNPAKYRKPEDADIYDIEA